MGNVIGIVAEYNPFHNGHARLIGQTRARLGADCPVVCIMSGDFVQRGSPAVYAKFARAEAAARCGADLVLELPTPRAMASAGAFARGAVGLLAAPGGGDAADRHIGGQFRRRALQDCLDGGDDVLRQPFPAALHRPHHPESEPAGEELWQRGGGNHRG